MGTQKRKKQANSLLMYLYDASVSRMVIQGFLQAVSLAFPLVLDLSWVISTSAMASDGKLLRMRSMVFW